MPLFPVAARIPSVRNLARVGACGLGLCVLLPRAMEPAAAQASRPMEVTSDSAAYCQHLAARVLVMRRSLPGPAPEVDALLDRGQRLCAAGLVRPGLNRLRHALLELHETRKGE